MTQSQLSSERDDLLGQVVDEFFKSAAQGESPDISDYMQRYPEIAELLKVAIPAMRAAEEAAHRPPAEPANHSEKQLGDFRILRQLGRGGMGVVYEAEQISMGRRVALKVLPLAGLVDELKIQRFHNEVRAVAALEHPHIVSVYTVGEERGVHYYAMRLIRGRSLAQVISSLRDVRDEGEVLHGQSVSQITSMVRRDDVDHTDPDATAQYEGSDAQETEAEQVETIAKAGDSTVPGETRREYFRSVATLGIQAASALQHAHEQGVIHRDIKPANLLLDRSSQLYVTDFGLARVEADVGVTMTGDLIGTLRYMAPEQALAKRVVVDHRADIYSLAVTLYELLALQPAYPADDRQQLLKQIAFEEPTSLRRVDPQIPTELETIVHKAMSKDMDERYSSAQELADDLQFFLDHRPINARPPTLPQIVAKWTRRNPAIVWASVITLLLVTIAFGISNLRVQKERDRAVRVSEDLRSSLYVQEVNVGYQAWLRGNTRRAQELLARQIPNEGEKDLRGLEWFHLASLCKAQRGRTIVENKQSGWCLSPDERSIATVVNGDVVSIELSSRNQSVLVAGVKLPNEPVGLAFSPDGKQLAIAEAEQVRVINVTNREAFNVTGNRPKDSVVFSPNGKWGANAESGANTNYQDTSFPDEAVQLWDARTGKIVWSRPAPGHTLRSFSPDSKWLVSGAWGKPELFLWDVADGTKQTITLDDYHAIAQVAFVDEKSFIVCGQAEPSIQRISIGLGPQVHAPSLRLPTTRFVASVALSSDRTKLALGTEANAVEVWDLQSGDLLWKRTRQRRIDKVQFLDEGRQILLSTGDIVELYNLEGRSATQLGNAQEIRLDWPDCMAAHGNDIVVPAPSYELVVWNPATGDKRTLDFKDDMRTIDPPKTWAATVAFSPDGSRIASAGAGLDDHTIRIWDARSGQLIDRYQMSESVFRVAFSPDGRLLAAGTARVTLWDTTTSEIHWVGPRQHENERTSTVVVCFSPDGKWLITGGGPWREGGRGSIWNLQGAAPQLVYEFDHAEIVLDVAVSNDSRWLAAGDYTGRIAIYDLEDPRKRIELAGHAMAVQSLVFTPDGKTLISGAYDGGIKLWQVRSWQELAELHEPASVGAIRVISNTTMGLGLAIGTRRIANGPADLRVHWMDDSTDWDWLRSESSSLSRGQPQ